MTEPLTDGPATPATRRVAFALELVRRRTGAGRRFGFSENRGIPARRPAGLRPAGRAEGRAALMTEVTARRRMLAPRLPQGVDVLLPPDRFTEPQQRSSGAPAAPAAPAPDVRVAPSAPPRSTPPVAEPPPAVLRAGSMPLSHRTQALLARLLDFRIPAVRLHVGAASDAVLRDRRADALTFGRHVLVRTDRYAPDRIAGLALLGHEVAHVAQNRDAAAHPPGPHEQEAVALGVERRLRRAPDPIAVPPAFGAPAGVPAPTVPTNGGPPIAPSSGASAPVAAAGQAAASGRVLDARPAGADAGSPVAGPDLRKLTDLVYRDILSRIRTEFERGG